MECSEASCLALDVAASVEALGLLFFKPAGSALREEIFPPGCA